MRKWVRPSVYEEKFSVNEAVSACIEGTIQCYYPGKSPYVGNDGTDTIKISKDFADQDGWVTNGMAYVVMMHIYLLIQKLGLDTK